jgi:hypothetical protein
MFSSLYPEIAYPYKAKAKLVNSPESIKRDGQYFTLLYERWLKKSRTEREENSREK